MASSQKIILNADGSVKLTILGNYIQKGNNGVDEIYIGVVALPSSVSGVANFELPNGDVNTIAGVYQAQISDGQGSSYKGFKFTLTQAQTLYVGDVKMSLQLTDANSNVLYSYSSVLTINPAVMTPSEQQITQAQWNSLVSSLAGYQLQYAQPNVRGYNSLADAQADTNNLATNQIILYKDNNEWHLGVYNGTAIVSITTISDKYLPLSGGTLTNGGFHIGDGVWEGGELISSPANRRILVHNATGEKLIEIYSNRELGVHNVINPTADKDASNKQYVDSEITKVVDGTTQVGIAGKAVQDQNGDVINTTYQKVAEKGIAGGYASLDSGGKVPTAQLPSYVDDVLEYANLASFPATGSASVIYVALDTNLTYRWSGSAYVEISPSLALGETSSTAYCGDRGKTAYDHSQLVDGSNPHGTTFSSLASKPTTLSGFGITDAVSETRTIAGIPLSADIATDKLLKSLGDSSVYRLIANTDYSVETKYISIDNGTTYESTDTTMFTLAQPLKRGETIIFKSVGVRNAAYSNLIAKMQIIEKRVLSDNSVLTLQRNLFPQGTLVYNSSDISSYTATQDLEYVRFCGKTEELTSFGVYKITPENVDYSEIDGLLTLKWNNNTYVSSDKKGYNFNPGASNDYTIRSNVIELNCGDCLVVKGKAYSYYTLDNYAFVCLTNSDGTKLERELVVGGSIDTTTREFSLTYTATKKKEYVMVFDEKHFNSYLFVSVIRNKFLEDENARRMVGQSSTNEYVNGIFRKVICVGDSITQGIVNYTNENSQQISMCSEANYPKFLAQLTNWKVKNAGNSGSYPITWWSTLKSNYDFSKYDCCIIALGASVGLTDTIDEDTTVSAGQDYNNYANTNTGRYCSLIEYILAQNPNIKIFIEKYCLHISETHTTNVVIEKIAQKYNLPVINWFNPEVVPLLNSQGFVYMKTDYQRLHYNGQGYLAIAKLILSEMTQIILDNPTEYQLDKEFQITTDDYNFFNDGLPTEDGLYFIKAKQKRVAADDLFSYEFIKVPLPPQSETVVLKSVNGVLDWYPE